MPATRDRYLNNPLARVLQPEIAQKREAQKFFHHDKLDIKDIDGAVTNTYGRQKYL